MSNKMLLKQARAGFKQLINENRSSFSVEKETDSSNPWADTTNPTFTGRISHESSRQAPDLSQNPAGLSTDLQRFLLVEYNVNFLSRGEIITDSDGKRWKLGPVDPLKKFGGVHGYQSPLEEAV